jgi:Peptidase A4 family
MHLRLLSRTALAGASALGLFFALGAGTASAAVHPAAHGSMSPRAEALALLKHLKVGDHGTNHAMVGHASVNSAGLKKVASGNWSGYADYSASTKYSKVAGAWTEPTGKCTSTTSLAAFWVGIDGFKSGTVEQDGTLIECVSGKVHYYSWWELYPTNDIQIVGSTVKPGDKITASVVKSGTKYALKLTDSTTPANSFSKTATCAATTCVDSSAEWIAEAPSGSSGVYPLTNYGTWSLSGATVTGGSKSGTIKSFPDYEITMESSTGAVESQPGPLNTAGNAFKTTWKSA